MTKWANEWYEGLNEWTDEWWIDKWVDRWKKWIWMNEQRQRYINEGMNK